MPSATQILSRAFASDPVITHFFSGWRRRVAYPVFFGDVVLGHLGQGHAYGLRQDGTLRGVALWTPPHPRSVGPGQRLRETITRSLLLSVYPRAARALLSGFAQLAPLHPETPHWYLAFVGIEPRFQGRGYGQRILEPVLQQADAARVPCYLETPFPRTRSFYRRLGFEITGEHRPFAGAPPVWTLLRPPHPTIVA